YQFNPRVGDGRSNLDKLRRAIHQAKQSGVELIVFPELAICGYPPRDLLDRSGFVRDQVALVNELAEDAEGIAVCCGLVTENEEPTGAPYRNALAFLRDGRVERLYYKQLL